MNRPLKIVIGVVVGLALLWGLTVALSFLFLDFVVDVLWYNSLGYLRFLFLKMGYRYLVFGGVTLLFFLVIFLNFWIASRYLGVNLRNQGGVPGSGARQLIEGFRTGSLKVYTPVSLLLAIPLAMPLYRNWEKALMFFFAPQTGERDELFNLDISYYLFTLPIFTLLQGRLLITLVFLSAALGILYAAEMKLLDREGQPLYLGARIHLSIMALLVFAVLAWGYVLEAHMLQYSTANEPLFFGPGFAEIRVSLPLIWASGIFTWLTALMLIVAVNFRRGLVPLFLCGGLALASIGARNWNLIPAAVNRFHVGPNIEEVQGQFVQTSIDATLSAYNLANAERRNYAQLRADARIPELGDRRDIDGIPLWDYELLADVYRQKQALTQFYRFSDVDTARYTVRGRLHQVNLAGREVFPDQLPGDLEDQRWLNRHLKYTHGFGAVMTPAAQRGEEEMRWFLRNMPPISPVGLEINNPALYHGTGTYHYAIAPNRGREFHYPGDNEASEVLYDYTGTGGIRIHGFVRKLLFAVYFREHRIFFNRQTLPESRILIRRNIRERIETLTPFLRLDNDPYLVVAPDRMYWIQDAYTTSTWFPNAKYIPEHDLNYIRNSVKIVVDAYDGTVTYYLWEPDCPIAQAYSRMYPGLFRPKSEMSDFLRTQVRYPRDIFNIQMSIYRIYHQLRAETFIKQQDIMVFANFPHGDMQIPMEPYFLTLNLIDFDQPEFFLVTPMLPEDQDNLRALAIMGCDDENYGRLIVYYFPRGDLTFGPTQINALIDQNTEIAQHITLWNQQGTEVKRGKMIVFPLGQHIIYIQPLYLEATARTRIPQLKRVIVSSEGIVVMAPNLEEAIDRLKVRLHEQRNRNQEAGL